MNAAAKAIHQSSLFTGHLQDLHISKSMGWVFALLLAVLFSALAIVDVTNQKRVTVSQLQRLESQTHQLEIQKGQLLLEQASLATPARVETWAVQKLQMKLPSKKDILLLKMS